MDGSKLSAVMAERGEDATSLAAKTGVARCVIAAAASGAPGVVVGLQDRQRIATGLQTTSRELFPLPAAVEDALQACEAQGHPRHVADPGVLRSVEAAVR